VAQSPEELPPKFSHLDSAGLAQMVNVADKPVTVRRATARAVCIMKETTAEAIRSGLVKKGEVFSVARVAAMMAAKRTADLIPLCHALPLDAIQVEFRWNAPTRLEILVTSQATAKTGVEMEALCGASVAALTVYDMCKSNDPAMSISEVQLLNKSGGVKGDFDLRDFDLAARQSESQD
jgi:cyclic pyranopterin monophosphate synthase